MKNILLILVILLVSCKLSAQFSNDFYLCLSKANACFADNKYKESCEWYDLAFKYQPNAHFGYQYLQAAKCNIILNNKINTFAYLQKSIEYGMTWENINTSDSIWNDIKLTRKWKELQKKYDKLHSKYLSGINFDLLTDIISYGAVDQSQRNEIATQCPNLLISSDSINLANFKDLLNKYGFPSYNSFPIKYRIYMWVIIIHACNDSEQEWNFFKHLLISEKDKGNVLPNEIAVVANLRYNRQYQMSLYGTINHDGQFSPPIQNIAEVDKLRQEIGLESLVDYAKKRKAVLPEGYVVPSDEFYYKNHIKK
ncbi:MAG: hypothetical protein KA174_05080 [Chitinophagales bacterium]|jgi:hypothetical protein|nr:hypothetical protein [Sphingobacteriales bacterium]MBP6660032.1 hypothetical protein [Chitinophagales bacterium]